MRQAGGGRLHDVRRHDHVGERAVTGGSTTCNASNTAVLTATPPAPASLATSRPRSRSRSRRASRIRCLPGAATSPSEGQQLFRRLGRRQLRGRASPGSPYHTRLIDLDGSGGNQDRSLSADAVIFPASITIVKNTVPDSSQSFSFTDTGAGLVRRASRSRTTGRPATAARPSPASRTSRATRSPRELRPATR